MWQVEQLRLTMFPSAGLDASVAQGWWQRAVGRQPDSSSLNRRVGVVTEDGQIGGEGGPSGVLSLQAQSIRVDWRWTNPEMPDEQQWSLVGAWDDSKARFLQLMEPWIGDVQFGVQRLAVGVVLLSPVENLQAGYTGIQTFLPFPLDPSARDFSYQINRQRHSESVLGLVVNRLSKWSVARRELLQFAIGPSGPVPSVDSRQAKFAIRAELDISSAQEWRGELPADQLANLFREFADLADELADKGDVP